MKKQSRRKFIINATVAGLGSATVFPTFSFKNAVSKKSRPSISLWGSSPEIVHESTWLPLDWWHIEHQDNVKLQQGQPEWVPEATYEDPNFDYLGFWPSVWQDTESRQWRMLYFATGLPLTLMGAESDDGIRWRPINRPDIKVIGEKYAPNHLFTLPSANGGPIYLDPVAADGKPWKFYAVQRGGPAADRAQHDPNSYFHEIVTGEGVKNYLADNVMVTSADGLHWKLDPEARWGGPPWHPDPPVNCYYNEGRGEHVMITRPGWGDRRIAIQTSPDAKKWSNLELLMQPDPTDLPQTQFYGMKVVPYSDIFLGLLWMAHFSSSERLERFNQLWGPIDCQLAYSFDGRNFHRGLRESFVPLNEPGLPGSGVVYPTTMLEHNGQLRIYSGASRDLHHQYTKSQFVRKGQQPPSAVIMHTLRKDGFTYLASHGNWASLTTKPLALFAPELRLNVLAPYGELAFQVTDLLSKPISGYTYADCVPLKEMDSLDAPLRFRNKPDLSDLMNKPLRLQMKFRGTRFHAMRGQFRWLDALGVTLLNDGKPIGRTYPEF
jgi:hypothetical protein